MEGKSQKSPLFKGGGPAGPGDSLIRPGNPPPSADGTPFEKGAGEARKPAEFDCKFFAQTQTNATFTIG